jgi:serine/threonine-protein kinase
MIEHGVAFGRHYIALEFLIGGDLREVMDAHRRQLKSFPTPMALHVVLEVLKGLAYFHTATTRTGTRLNLIHHDVNPANVFFSGLGEVKLGDFGVASSSHLAMGPGAGIAVGKLSYLAPEQTRGEQATPASDLWSVGVMLHELVVGYHPFKHADPTGESEPDEDEVMALIRSPKLSIPDYVDRPLAVIISKALTVDLRNRYHTAGEFAGPLFAYMLDHNLIPQPRASQEWLEGVLGLLV